MVDLQMDSRAMDFEDDQFELVLDKALFDCLLCGESTAKNVTKHLNEVHRVLKPGGVYLVVSFGAPEQREHYFRKVRGVKTGERVQLERQS